MRVAFVAADLRRGPETERRRRLRRTAETLADAGHDVTVCCSRWWAGPERTREEAGVTYRAVSGSPGSTRFAARLPVALRRLDPDVVHAAHDRPGHVVAAGAGGAPVVVDWYWLDDDPVDGGALARARRRLSDRLRRSALSRAARVVTPSRLVRRQIVEFGAADEAVAVVPNGVDFQRVRAVDPADCGDVVYSRALDGDANLEPLLLALAEVRERDWTATVVGDGPARAAYEQQAADLRIDDRVTFVGEQSVGERLALFKSAHVYVHTARRAPFATDLLRAMACGCVGVVEYHAASSAHELVERRDRGIPVTDDTELDDALVAAGDLPRRERDEGFLDFDEPAVCERYLECYREARAAAGRS